MKPIAPFFSCDEYECQRTPPHAIVAVAHSDYFMTRRAASNWTLDNGGTVVEVPGYDAAYKVRRPLP